MPVLQRYLLRTFLSLFFFTLSSFIGVLLIARLREIARFASLGNSGCALFFFILYQIPYILPIAAAISCLLSAFLLYQKLSLSRELSALRSCGVGWKKIFGPPLFAASFLSLINFLIVSEFSAQSRLLTQKMLRKERMEQPFALLQGKRIAQMGNLFIDLDHVSSQKIRDLTVVGLYPKKKRLFLLYLDSLSFKKEEFHGENLSLIFTEEGKETSDSMLTEHRNEVHFSELSLPGIYHKKEKPVHKGAVPFRQLFAAHLLENTPSIEFLEEIMRRVSLGLSPLLFTFLGLSFAVQYSSIYRSGISVFLLSFFFLGSHLFAKGFAGHPILSTIFYTVPSLVVLAASAHFLKKRWRGG